MGRQGPENDKFKSPRHSEKPMDNGDATGAPTPGARYNRELARKAWTYLETHDPSQPLPEWISDYLREVAFKISESTGPKGGLPRDAAHAALGLVGEQWPKHHPESVYAIIEAWRDPERPGGPLVDGRKAGAVRYIEEYMDNDPNTDPATVIEWYRKGQKANKQQRDEAPSNEAQGLTDFDATMPTQIVISQPQKKRR